MSRRGAALLLNPLAGRLLFAPIARAGYRRYRQAGTTPAAAYVAMRKLFGSSPRSFERLADRSLHEHERLSLSEGANGLAAGVVDDTVEALRADGCSVLPTRLAARELHELETAARAANCTLIGGGPQRQGSFTSGRTEAPRYDLAEHDVLAIPAVQRLLADESLLAVAQGYLRAAPVQDMVAMWWSVAYGEQASSEAAQLFHFDLDRLRFLKVFVYVTDVDESRGPHVYVRGSHRELPLALRDDRRYTDAEVAAVLPGQTTTIIGSAGTVFLADTRGLHKGLPVQRGERLVFQLEYASSLFGTIVERPVLQTVEPELAEAMRRFPATYERLRVRSVGGHAEPEPRAP